MDLKLPDLPVKPCVRIKGSRVQNVLPERGILQHGGAVGLGPEHGRVVVDVHHMDPNVHAGRPPWTPVVRGRHHQVVGRLVLSIQALCGPQDPVQPPNVKVVRVGAGEKVLNVGVATLIPVHRRHGHDHRVGRQIFRHICVRRRREHRRLIIHVLDGEQDRGSGGITSTTAAVSTATVTTALEAVAIRGLDHE